MIQNNEWVLKMNRNLEIGVTFMKSMNEGYDVGYLSWMSGAVIPKIFIIVQNNLKQDDLLYISIKKY